VFNLNVQQIPQLRNVFQTQDLDNLSLLVKEVKLPSYKFNVETMNQYNRKRKVQTQIEYDPITCIMHDDASDLSRTLWYNYYAYYYKDASQKYHGMLRSPTVVWDKMHKVLIQAQHIHITIETSIHKTEKSTTGDILAKATLMAQRWQTCIFP
jgi:hypothetical protein